MVKEKRNSKSNVVHPLSHSITHHLKFGLVILCVGIIGIILAGFYQLYQFEDKYKGKIYPGVYIDQMSFAGKTPEEVRQFFEQKNSPLKILTINLTYQDKIATIAASDLALYYDANKTSSEAYLTGRSGEFFEDLKNQWITLTRGFYLSSHLNLNESFVNDSVDSISEGINISPEDSLFQFENGKVVMFKPSKEGLKVNRDKTVQAIKDTINNVALGKLSSQTPINVHLTVETVVPKITTANSNTFGIKELLATGTSKFSHSIPGRIHNVELAASRINGHLIPPGETFSFNEVLGDVSSQTGFAPAYVIKDGKTVLGDGGGVCQVSTTLFRAAMLAGLPIIERHAHAYRVGYYEQDSPPGLDATVFAPSVDFKFKNDTPSYLLIQSNVDTENLAMKFEIYGTSDGRKGEYSKPVVLSQIAPPPDSFQDDPTLPNGVIKQVDFSAWGAKVVFDYKVTRAGEDIIKETYVSNYRPWQAVFLKGTKI